MKKEPSDHLANQADLTLFLSEHPHIDQLELILPDQHGCLRGKYMLDKDMAKVFEKGVRFPCSNFALNIRGDVVEKTHLGVKTGEKDYDCFPLKNTLVEVPWKSKSAQVLLTMRNEKGNYFFADPRGLVDKVYKRLQKRNIWVSLALEMEFYLLSADMNKKGEPQLLPEHQYKREKDIDYQVYSLQDLDNYAAFLDDVYRAAEKQNVQVDSIIAESSPGQFEINLKHHFLPFRSCDEALMLKRIIKSIAAQHGLLATFMAKPFSCLDGSGTHVHIGLNDEKGNNLFAKQGIKTPMLRYAVAGLLNTMNQYFLMQCPHINSYKRFCQDCYVGFGQHWGVNNRTVPVRVVREKTADIHLEQRVAGADANPYLVVAACLAAIDYGLEKQKEPPMKPLEGDGRDEKLGEVFMHRFIDDFRHSKWIGEYFGEKWQEIYSMCRLSELQAYEKVITLAEYDWYLTKI